LAQAVATNPSSIGIGLGEDTAMLITDENKLEAVGSGLVVIGTSGAAAPDVVPMAVLALLEVMPQVRVRLIENTMDKLARSKSGQVVSWCPSCQVQIGEVALPNYEMHNGTRPFDLNPFLVFLADRAETLAGLMQHRVERRVALHERPVLPAVQAAVRKLLSIVPGVELVEIDVPRVGTQANSLAVLPAFKRELVGRELAAVADAGVTTLATIYHACHRELCAHETTSPFKIVNFLELVGEAMGVEKTDLFKQWKMMQDVDRVLAEVAKQATATGLDLESVREVLVAHMLGEQPLPVDFRGTPAIEESEAAPVRVISE